MRLIVALTLSLALLGNVSQAATLSTRVFKVLAPETANEPFLVLSESDARIYKVPAHQIELVQTLLTAATTHGEVQISANLDRTVTAAKLRVESDLAAYSAYALNDSLDTDSTRLQGIEYSAQDSGFSPTVISSESETARLFDNMRKLNGRGNECYQRAMIWTYDFWRHQSMNTQKVFIFYSPQYQRLTDEEWWFHVAPLVQVQTSQGVQERVMDPTFLDKPVSVQEWIEFFIDFGLVHRPPSRLTEAGKKKYYERLRARGNGPNCPVIDQFTMDLYRGKYSQQNWCFIRKVPMFYYDPAVIEARDGSGLRLNNFRCKDLEHAFKAAQSVFTRIFDPKTLYQKWSCSN